MGVDRREIAVVNDRKRKSRLRREGRRVHRAAHDAGAAQQDVHLGSLSSHRVAEQNPVDGSSVGCAGHQENFGGEKEVVLGGADEDGVDGAAGMHLAGVDDGQVLPGVQLADEGVEARGCLDGWLGSTAGAGLRGLSEVLHAG